MVLLKGQLKKKSPLNERLKQKEKEYKHSTLKKGESMITTKVKI